MADGITPWEVDWAITAGRIAPTVVGPPAGDYVFCLGSHDANHYIVAQPGDYTEVSQTASFGGTTALIRSTVTVRAPSQLPIGMLFRIAILIDDVEVVGRDITNDGSLLTRFDLAANVTRMIGDGKLAFRLSVIGTGDPSLIELPGVFVDQIVFDGPAVSLFNQLLGIDPYFYLRADFNTQDTGTDELTDQGTNGFDFLQGTGANQPPLVTSSPLNNQPAIDFDGTNHYLTTSGSVVASTDLTFLYVIDADDLTDNQALLGDAGTSGIIYHEGVAGVNALGYYDGTHQLGPAAITGPQQIALVLDATAGEGQYYRNGSAIGSAVTYDGTFWGAVTLTVGARATGVTPFDGRIADMACYRRVLNASELTLWNAYCSQRYAL